MVGDFRKSEPPQQGWAALPLVVAVLEEQRAAAPQVAPRAGRDLPRGGAPPPACPPRKPRLDARAAPLGVGMGGRDVRGFPHDEVERTRLDRFEPVAPHEIDLYCVLERVSLGDTERAFR